MAFLFSLACLGVAFFFFVKYLLKGWNMSHVSKHRRKIWRTTLFAYFGYFEKKGIKDILMKFNTWFFIYGKGLSYLYHILIASPTYSRWSCILVRFYWLVKYVLVGECFVCILRWFLFVVLASFVYLPLHGVYPRLFDWCF